ncbi:MAG: Rsd/AlgQ family anti-sigma factor [Gammaproteobacteria bacterium]|nr:Rsd/AlgQ family anti-sigma factor [Gammaproteobacteria bacterium]
MDQLTSIVKTMSSQNKTVDRRDHSRHLINDMVRERTKMLSLYSDLASMHPFSNIEKSSKLLELFCQSLIDYTADTHFRLYKYIDEKSERRQSILDIANHFYPRIVAITQNILAFNDKYEGQANDLTTLEKDLSDLGVRMTDRIEMEDQIIQAMF